MRTTAVLVLFAFVAQAQNTWYIDVNGTPPGAGTQGDPYTSIQYAIDRPSTQWFDTLLVAPGVYVENLNSTNELLRIRSTHGPLQTTLRAAVAGPVVRLDSFSTLDGFTVTGFIPGGGANVVRLLDGNLRNCVIRDNAGRALFVLYDAIVERCTLVNNASLAFVDASGAALFLHECITDLPLPPPIGNAQLAANYTIADFGGEPESFGIGNLDVDPLLWDEDGGDVRLRPGSPAIDAGNPSSPLDPDGSRRDIGAVAYDAGYLPAPLVYCTSQISSAGCTPSMSSIGSASATSPAECWVTCEQQINQRSGLMFYGYAPRAHAYQGGWLCVQAPTIRTAVQTSGGAPSGVDCSGVFSYDLNARIRSGVDPALAAGVFVYCQYWARDPAGPGGSNRSEALRLAIGL